MPTFGEPTAVADQAREALRGLAHATRYIEDPRDIYGILGSLSAAAASMSQSLHRLGAVHDEPTGRSRWVAGGSRDGRAAAYQVSWDLHRAGEILRQVAESIDHAHEAEAAVTYEERLPANHPTASRAATRQASVRGIGL